jgi:hypothetical protein
MRRIVELIDWAARIHFIGTVACAGAGWVVTFFAASAGGWDPVAVWLASLAAGAFCAIIFIAFIANRFPATRVAHKAPSAQSGSDIFNEARSFFNSWLYPTAQNVDQVLRRIMNAMRRSSNETIRGYEGLIQRSIADEERASLSHLSNAIRGIEPTSDEDLQNRLGRYYSAYQPCRTWIAKGLELTGVDLRSDAIFQEWLRLDEKFLDQLRQLSGPSKYDRLRELINAVGWGENITRDLRANK